MQVVTTKPNQAAMEERAPDSPLKNRRDARFSHFSRRYRCKLADSDIFSLRFNSDASMTAVALFDGSL